MKNLLFFVSVLLAVPAFAEQTTTPNAAASQAKASTQAQLKAFAAWLGKWTLTCTSGGEVKLTAFAKNGMPVITAKYGDADIFPVDPSNTEIQQIQVGDVITLLVSGPDYDEGSALVVIPGNFSETVGPKSAGFPVLKRSDTGTALVYGDSTGETTSTEQLDCELK